MTSIIHSILRREPRYQLGKDRTIAVVVERPVDGGVEPMEAELVDISRGGAKLRVPQALSVNELLTVDIKPGELEGIVSVAAEVCWTCLAGADRWWVGCSFKPKIPEAVLAELAVGGHLDRRQHVRDEIALRTTAKWELDSRCTLVWLLDLSAGGFCVLSQEMATPGERLMLQLADPGEREILVTAKAQWQVETDEGYVLGCEFVDKHGYKILRRIVDSKQPIAPRHPSSRWLRFLWPW